MHLRQAHTSLAGILIGLTVLFSAAGYAWNILVVQAPQRVFYDALANDLTLKGVDCTVTKPASNGQSSTQHLWLDLAGKTSTRVATTLSQNGTTVKTEDINTPSADYIRYVSITLTKDKNGKMPDTSKLMNVWAKQPRTSASGQAMLGKVAMGGCIVPLADLSKPQAATLMTDVKKGKIFQTDMAHSKRHWQFNEPYRDYSVKIEPTAYVLFMKKVDAAYGAEALSGVSVSDFQNMAAAALNFRIGAVTHRIESVSYSDGHQAFSFSNYDERPDVAAPSKTISIADLQKRLQSVR